MVSPMPDDQIAAMSLPELLELLRRISEEIEIRVMVMSGE